MHVPVYVEAEIQRHMFAVPVKAGAYFT